MINDLFFMQPFLDGPTYHWLSYRLPFSCPDLHTLCPPHCTDIFRFLPDTIVRSVIQYLKPQEVAKAARKKGS